VAKQFARTRSLADNSFASDTVVRGVRLARLIADIARGSDAVAWSKVAVGHDISRVTGSLLVPQWTIYPAPSQGWKASLNNSHWATVPTKTWATTALSDNPWRAIGSE
jgi:hypothetical protein